MPLLPTNGDDVDEIDGFNRFGVDLLVSGTVLFAAVISEFSPTRTLHAGFDHVKTFDPNLLAHTYNTQKSGVFLLSIVFFNPELVRSKKKKRKDRRQRKTTRR